MSHITTTLIIIGVTVFTVYTGARVVWNVVRSPEYRIRWSFGKWTIVARVSSSRRRLRTSSFYHVISNFLTLRAIEVNYETPHPNSNFTSRLRNLNLVIV
ncbi:hypothetical protein WG66_010056 [Moniliophthora roreri]|nr:hypothetical protein WG66_010056 [Moniliophthora roreri]